ncbi:EscU/YscU/HrcU family type III secretion system export apparatus switch protein [Glaciimonas sp. PAMC28666]|uniref:EscU/YscU/HrcU family type III secretion system export apparatus switch protein n=1 Tax=Glaciimonas sp. PAMC28666 TaxID=2807626 RepID=UPI001963F669|nr:EscU/YscU/HrcU family type III secretion system export apparatus switch protein [Glaciimonas sp. PAMC28666]
MSAASKTEKPSAKKKKDAAKRGQSFKARDVVVASLTFCGVFFCDLAWFSCRDWCRFCDGRPAWI